MLRLLTVTVFGLLTTAGWGMVKPGFEMEGVTTQQNGNYAITISKSFLERQ